MSMISAQIDELREYADRADGTFPLLASALRDAADTIWQLRDDLQRATAENAKLRELVRDMTECMDNSIPHCKRCRFKELNCQAFKFDKRMRELGVEVDG